MPTHFRLMGFDNIVAIEGLRGIKSIKAEETFDDRPYLEFVYDGGTIIPIGPFKDDIEMKDYHTAIINNILIDVRLLGPESDA